MKAILASLLTMVVGVLPLLLLSLDKLHMSSAEPLGSSTVQVKSGITLSAQGPAKRQLKQWQKLAKVLNHG